MLTIIKKRIFFVIFISHINRLCHQSKILIFVSILDQYRLMTSRLGLCAYWCGGAFLVVLTVLTYLAMHVDLIPSNHIIYWVSLTPQFSHFRAFFLFETHYFHFSNKFTTVKYLCLNIINFLHIFFLFYFICYVHIFFICWFNNSNFYIYMLFIDCYTKFSIYHIFRFPNDHLRHYKSYGLEI